jgi:hypothetical protein
MTVFFGDVARKFVCHYFKLLATGADEVVLMYTEKAELQINAQLVRGPSTVVDELAKLGKLALLPTYAAHPYNDSGVIVAAKAASETAKYIMTFILALVDNGNQFGITHQIVHATPK